MPPPFKNNDLLLFTGDSITDCNRDRANPDSLGMGFANMLAGQLGLAFAKLNLGFRNTGIGGDSTCHLLARWSEDCIDLKPDWLSILIGLNNTWRRYDSNDPTPDNIFEKECRELLDRIAMETTAKPIVCSPFIVPITPAMEAMREDLDPKIEIIRELACEYGAIWVDFDAAFASALKLNIPSYWAVDGIHPSPAGHALMAKTWMDVVCGGKTNILIEEVS